MRQSLRKKLTFNVANLLNLLEINCFYEEIFLNADENKQQSFLYFNRCCA